jgi:hypothetical protein
MQSAQFFNQLIEIAYTKFFAIVTNSLVINLEKKNKICELTS